MIMLLLSGLKRKQVKILYEPVAVRHRKSFSCSFYRKNEDKPLEKSEKAEKECRVEIFFGQLLLFICECLKKRRHTIFFQRRKNTMIFADKLIDLRKKNGWSQEELAEKLNVSRQSVSKWEGAQSVPDISRIIQLSDTNSSKRCRIINI